MIAWIHIFVLVALFVAKFIPEFGIIVVQYFIFVSCVHILVWFWGFLGRHVWSNKKHLKIECKKSIAILLFSL